MRCLTGQWPICTVKGCGSYDLNNCFCCCLWAKTFPEEKSDISDTTANATPNEAFAGMNKGRDKNAVDYTKTQTLPQDSRNSVPPPYNPEIDIHAV